MSTGRKRLNLPPKKAEMVPKRGRPSKATLERLAQIKARVEVGEAKTTIALELGISRDTLYRYLGQMKRNPANIDVSALTEAPLKLVRKYAVIHHKRIDRQRLPLELDDVISILGEVLTNCLSKFDSKRGAATFETYFRKAAENRMMSEVKKLMRERSVVPFNFYHDDDGLITFEHRS